MNRRTISIVVLPAIAVVGVVVFLLAIRHRLPESVAIHWGMGGAADGFADRDVVPWLFGGFAVLIGGLLAVIAASSTKVVAGARLLWGLPLGVVAFVAALGVAVTAAQIDATVAPDLPGWAIPLALGAGLAGWAVAAWLAGPPAAVPASTEPAPPDAPRLDLPASHTAVWSGRTPVAKVLPVIAAGTALLGIVLGLFASWSVTVIIFPVVLLVVGSMLYTVTAGPGGIRVSGALFGYPRVTVPLREIASVEAGEVSAWSFGGWGIRIGRGGESAVITRSGPALIVTRTDGAVLRVSLDEPQEAAAALSTLLDRRS